MKMENTNLKFDYFSRVGISATLLKSIIKQSPVHAATRMRTFKPSPTMNLGTAAHCAILEPHRYNELIAICPDCDRRTKTGKAEYASFVESAGKKTVIKYDQHEAVIAMANAVDEHEHATELMQDTKREVEIDFAFDGETCKAKIDAVKGDNTIIDIKTTIDASPDAFARQSASLFYQMQMAWYAKAIGSSWKTCNCYVIAVENTEPYGVAVYRYDVDVLDNGWKLCCRALRQWRDYNATISKNETPKAYGDCVYDIELPAWAERV
jgi:hypothetical protein